MGRGTTLMQEVRRRKVWLMLLEGYNETEIAERLGVSRRTIVSDVKYLREHPEEIPTVEEDDFTTYVRTKIIRLLEEGKNVTDWQKLKILRDLAKSTVVRKQRKEESINVSWGFSDEEEESSKDKVKEDR